MDLINLWWLCFGALVAWLVQWVWDWMWFRARRQVVSTSVETQVATLASERDQLAGDLRACGDRRAALEGDLATLRAQGGDVERLRARVAELEPLIGHVSALNDENARLRAELAAPRPTSPGELTLGSVEVGGSDRGQLASLREYNLALHDELGATRKALARLSGGKGDPLIDIDGIGPVYQERLYEQGVITFDQLAAIHPERLRSLVAPNAIGELDTAAWVAQARAMAGQPSRDPLIDILGIGPVYEQRLLNAGVTSFAQLAGMTPAEVVAIIKPEAWQKIDAAAWIAEARELAAQQRAGTYRKGEN